MTAKLTEQRAEIIGWMNKDLNRGRTTPIFEELMEAFETQIREEEMRNCMEQKDEIIRGLGRASS